MSGIKVDLKLNSIIRLLSRSVNSFGVVLLMGMMVLVVTDVVLRRFFKIPVMGSYEVVQFLLIILIYLGLPQTTLQKSHISIGLGTARLTKKASSFLEVHIVFYSLCFFLLITVRNFGRAREMWLVNATSPLISIPVFPFYYIIALGCGIVSLVLFVQLLEGFKLVTELFQQKRIWYLFFSSLVIVFSFLILQMHIAVIPLRAGFIGIFFLFVLIAAKMPIGIAMGLVGLIGYCSLAGVEAGLSQLEMVPYSVGSGYLLSVVPLFILMGQFAYHSGLSQDLYETSYKWLGQYRGGLAMSTVAGCAAFAAVSGSSLATTVTIGSVALPGMKKYKYDRKLALGSIAAGGTLGILIPPSLVFILYGIMTEQSIGRLFMAGILPGVVTVALYFMTIFLLVWRFPHLGPRGPKTSLREKILSLRNTWSMGILFGLVMGGIYFGIFTPTEAGAVGAFGAFLIGLFRRRFNWKNLFTCLLETGRTTAMILMIFIGATLFNYFLVISNLPMYFAGVVSDQIHHPYGALAAIIFLYLALGCVMDPGSMVMVTIPIVFPIIQALGFNPIWFGVIVVLVAEIGCITPPVGINVFAVKGIAPDVPIGDIYRGILPFWFADILRLFILVLVPQLSLFLPGLIR
jgi:tripartite ATP-independent transporter DctM subunit